MANPHNHTRYGETWRQHRIDAWTETLEAIKDFVVFSGGWAWHFLSPTGHPEYKHAHDHKDCDLMVPPTAVGTVMGILQGLAFVKVRTKYDRLPSEENFRRYEKVIKRYVCHGKVSETPHQCFCLTDAGDKECFSDEFRLTIDFFVKDVPTLQVPAGWQVVRPNVLLGFYSKIHSSSSCWAVLATKALFANGAKPEDLIGDPQLLYASDLDIHVCPKCHWAGQTFALVETGGFLYCGGCEKYVTRNLGPPEFKHAQA